MSFSSRKGGDFEREVAGEFRAHGFDAQRVVCSGIKGEGDVEVDGLHLECKRCESLRIPQWFRDEQPKAKGKPFLLIFRRNREPARVAMDLRDFFRLKSQFFEEGFRAARATTYGG